MAIISFQHKFIFIKTTKTAGTSIETDLSSLVGADAVVTPIQPPEEGHIARNYMNRDGKAVFSNHMAAREIRDQIGEKVFTSMFRFCVEREPVSKCISHFHMLRNSDLHNPGGSYQASWQDYVDAGKFPIDLFRYSAMSEGKRHLLVDRILRYDALTAELKDTLRHLGIYNFELKSRAKSGYSKQVLVREDEVTPSQRAKIYEAFQPTLEAAAIDWTAPPAPLTWAK